MSAASHSVQPALFTAQDAAALLPVPAQDAKKYTRGCLLVVGGCTQYRGAPVMASLAAQRSGAGYVRLATTEHAAQSAQSRLLSATVTICDATPGGFLCREALPQIEQLAAKAKALLVGPGLGCNQDTTALLWAMLQSAALQELPWLLDADALSIIAQDVERFVALRAGHVTVITPHEGEAARLLGRKVKDRDADALELSRRCGVVAVLKGPGTLVADATNGMLHQIDAGGPELSKAGTGDVLAGMIAALLAQGLDPVDAACLGVYLHGTSGALAACSQSVVSALPEDVIDNIGGAVLALKGLSPALASAQDDALSRANAPRL